MIRGFVGPAYIKINHKQFHLFGKEETYRPPQKGMRADYIKDYYVIFNGIRFEHVFVNKKIKEDEHTNNDVYRYAHSIIINFNSIFSGLLLNMNSHKNYFYNDAKANLNLLKSFMSEKTDKDYILDIIKAIKDLGNFAPNRFIVSFVTKSKTIVYIRRSKFDSKNLIADRSKLDFLNLILDSFEEGFDMLKTYCRHKTDQDRQFIYYTGIYYCYSKIIAIELGEQVGNNLTNKFSSHCKKILNSKKNIISAFKENINENLEKTIENIKSLKNANLKNAHVVDFLVLFHNDNYILSFNIYSENKKEENKNFRLILEMNIDTKNLYYFDLNIT